jgi:hypothetical protein
MQAETCGININLLDNLMLYIVFLINMHTQVYYQRTAPIFELQTYIDFCNLKECHPRCVCKIIYVGGSQ